MLEIVISHLKNKSIFKTFNISTETFQVYREKCPVTVVIFNLVEHLGNFFRHNVIHTCMCVGHDVSEETRVCPVYTDTE